MNVRVCSALFMAASVLAGCAGGNTVPRASVKPVSQHAQVRVTVKIPNAGSVVVVKRRSYISPATQAILINSQAFNVSPSSPNCAPQAGVLTCSFAVDAPNLGLATFTITTYDQPLTADGQIQGNVLSTGVTTATITAGMSNLVKATINGVPSHVTISVADLTPPMGAPATIPITFDVRDADGYAIVGTFSDPIALQMSGQMTYGLQLETNGSSTCCNSIQASTDVVVLKYTGSLVKAVTITATLRGNTVYTGLFDPHPSFGPEKPVATSLNGGEALRTNDHVTWFTEPAKHSLAWYLPGGAITEIPTPSGGTPLHFGIGQFSTVILTESSNAIAMSDYNPNFTAAINEIPLTSPNAGPYAAVDASYGASQSTIYVSEFNAGKIGVLTYGDPLAGGQGWGLKEYATGRAGSTPAGMAFASAGLLVADPGANAIGLFAVSNNATTWYPVPSAGAHPTRIVSDSNSNYWFTEPGVSKVGRMDKNNAITEFACSGVPVQIVGTQTDVMVLTAAGDIDDYDPASGSYKLVRPPQSSAGPVVGIGDGFSLGDLVVMRSNGTTGAVLDYFYL